MKITRANGEMPIGVPFDWYGEESTIPHNCRILNGQNIYRSFPLFRIWGTKYGVGNGSTTFTLPDDRNRVRMGYGETTVGVAQEDQMQGHIHALTEHTYQQGYNAPYNNLGYNYAGTAVNFPSSTNIPSAYGSWGAPRLGSYTRSRNRRMIPIVRIY